MPRFWICANAARRPYRILKEQGLPYKVFTPARFSIHAPWSSWKERDWPLSSQSRHGQHNQLQCGADHTWNYPSRRGHRCRARSGGNGGHSPIPGPEQRTLTQRTTWRSPHRPISLNLYQASAAPPPHPPERVPHKLPNERLNPPPPPRQKLAIQRTQQRITGNTPRRSCVHRDCLLSKGWTALCCICTEPYSEV